MSWVDIVIIALAVLFGTIGVLRGVQKSALSLGAFLVAFLVAFFLANTVAEGFLGLEAVRKFVMAPEGFSLFTWLRDNIPGTAGASESFIDVNFYRPVAAIIEEAATGMQPQDAMALYLSFTVFSSIIGVCLFVVIRLLLSIVTMIVKSFIPKKKSAGSRAGGFFVGVAQGGLIALALTVVMSVYGGFTFIGAFNTVETEYEKSVLGKYLNVAAYGIKDTCFLPNADMFDRIVNKSEFQVDPDDRNDPDDLSGDRLKIYCGIGNLNYSQDVYVEDETTKLLDKEKLEGKDAYLRSTAGFADCGFDVTVKAIMDYNNNAVANFKTTMQSVGDDMLGVYIDAIYDSSENITDVWKGVLVRIAAYNEKYVALKNNPPADASDIQKANADLKSRYDEIKDDFEKLKTKYAMLSAFGTLELGEYPALYQAEVV